MSVRRIRIPPPLGPGARVAVVAPASAAPRPEVQAGCEMLRCWGLRPMRGPSVGRPRGDLAGSDESRLESLLWALASPEVDAVWAVRGGWGTARLLDGLTRRLRRPKARWVVGFSDLTALHGWLLGRGLASLYAPHVVELADRGRYIPGDLRSMLFGEEREFSIACAPRGRLLTGVAEGTVFAACLSVLAALAGTRHAPRLEGTILVLEDVGEPPYKIDRLLWQLGAAGMLRGIRGLAFGQFTGCRPGPGRASRTLRTVVEEHALRLGVPSLCGLPVGHGRRVRAVLNGAKATLDADAGTLTMRVG